MANYNNNRSDRTPRNDSRGAERPQMHQALCSKCGKSCMVPFKPTGNRPIFCSNCFQTEGARQDPARRTDDHGSDRPQMERKMYDAVCDTCGNRCQIPFAPRAGKPVYCSHCFEMREKEGNGFRERPQNNDQIAAINTKLDKILALLSEAETINPTPEVVALEGVTLAEVIEVDKKETKKATIKKKAASKKKAS